MTKTRSFFRLAALLSSVLLAAGFVCYRAGVLNCLLPARTSPGISSSSPALEWYQIPASEREGPLIFLPVDGGEALAVPMPPSPAAADSAQTEELILSGTKTMMVPAIRFQPAGPPVQPQPQPPRAMPNRGSFP